jgi:subtilisin family serine protease
MILDDLDPRLVSKIGRRLRKKLESLEEGIGQQEERAEQQLEEAAAEVMARPDDAQAHYRLASQLASVGRLGEAEASYREAIELQPRYVDARYALARLLNDQGRFEDAESELEKVLDMDPWYWDAYFESSYALEKQGRPDDAAQIPDRVRGLRRQVADEIYGTKSGALPAQSDLEPSRVRSRGAAPIPPPGPQERLTVGVEMVYEPEVDDMASQMKQMETSRQLTRKKQEDFVALLQGLGIDEYDPHWFINIVYVDVTCAQLVSLLHKLNALMDDFGPAIERIDLARPVQAMIQGAILSQNQVQALSGISPVTVRAQPRSSATAIRADRVWARGLTGAGRRIAIIDTGICDEHLDLERKVTFPPAAQFRLPYVYGEAIQGGNYCYHVLIPPQRTDVAIELSTGLEYRHAQLQQGIHSAKLDLYIYEPEGNQPLSVTEEMLETDHTFFRKTYRFAPKKEGIYRIQLQGSDVDTTDTPWRGVLFKLSAKDLTNYPGDVLHFIGPYDDHGHGTHVAGIAAGTGLSSNGAYKGIAPGASLVCAKVLSYEGAASEVDLIEAIRWAVAEGVDIINISFGTYDEFCDGDCPICRAADRAVKDYRMVVVAAAGNLGPGENTITCPGKAERVLTVGSCTVDGKVSEFSSRGPVKNKPDLVAPGEGIVSCLSNRHFVSVRTGADQVVFQPLTPLSINSSYIGFSGTSMAAPHVAGAAALLLQADPTLTPERIKKILMDTADLLPGFAAADQGKGILNLDKALKAVPKVIVDDITSDQDHYAHDVAEIRLHLKVRNNSAAQLNNLRVHVSIEDERGKLVFSTLQDHIDMDPGSEVTQQVTWTDPGVPAGPYYATARVEELVHDFPPPGTVLVERMVDHYFTGAMPIFRIT